MRLFAMGMGGSLLVLATAGVSAPRERQTKPETVIAASIGSPNAGRLDGGKHLTQAPYLRVVPFYAESEARWGLPSLVALIDRAARRVARQYPDAVLSVGDLSRRAGGGLERHHSHTSGRDADLGFYVRSAANKPVLHERFVTFTPRGAAADVPGAVFDDGRNWALVQALLEDPSARISYVFVAAHIRARLLRYADTHGVPHELRQRAADVMTQPRQAAHDDHFHIRIACPPEQAKCVEHAVLRTPPQASQLVRIRLRSGAEQMLPVLPGAETESRAKVTPATGDRAFDAPFAVPMRSDHVGKRPLSKEAAADNLDP